MKGDARRQGEDTLSTLRRGLDRSWTGAHVLRGLRLGSWRAPDWIQQKQSFVASLTYGVLGQLWSPRIQAGDG